jgi:class 3 adenylate cyclase
MGRVARLQRKRFSDSTDVRVIPHGRIDVVELDDRVVGRLQWDVGWRWSVDLKPIVGTESCQFHHVGVALSGRLHVQMQDGVELEIGPGDVYEIPPGHDAWVVGDVAWVGIDFEAVRTFARVKTSAGRRLLASIVITDIVDSTAQAEKLGAGSWRVLVSRHNEVSERIVDQDGGQLIKKTGDGVIGLFDSAERAVLAAAAMGPALQPLGLKVRAAVNSGEVEQAQGDVRGLAVHAAARMLTVAGPDDVVVSSTVRELVDGTDLRFEDFGMHTLKGLTGQRQLYRLTR